MKKKLLIVSSVILLIIIFAFSASALTVPSIEFDSDSTIQPVDYSSHKAVSTVTLYGNADYVCMKVFADTNNDLYCLDVYSDSSYKKLLWSHTDTYKKGTSYQNILFDLTGAESRTYYAKAYVQKVSIYGFHKTDESTVVKFKFVVKKDGLAVKNMKVFMYGYENTNKGPAIYWYSVPGATGYHVYRHNGSEYVKIATVKATGSALSYYVDTASKNVCAKQYYKVKAYNSSGTSAISKNNVLAYVIKTPTVKAAINTSRSGCIKVTWNNVHSSCYYLLYRRTANTDWQLIEDTDLNSYYDHNVKSNEVYYYTVRAYNKNAISGYNPTGVSLRYVAMTNLNSVTSSSDGLNVSWKAVSGAERYYLYRRSDTKADWERLAVLKSTSYQDTSVEKNKIYYYTVRAEIGTVKGPYIVNGVSGAIVGTVVVNDITANKNGVPVISWQAVGGDAFYRVYRKGPRDASWERIHSTYETQYTDKTTYMENGEKFSYTVRAFVDTIGGGYNKTGKSFTYYGKIKQLKPSSVILGIGLTWENIAGVDGYNVYRKTAGENYILIGTATKNFYEDKTVVAGIDYTYKVAYIINGVEMSKYATEKTVRYVANNVKLANKPYVYDYKNNLWRVTLAEYDENAMYVVYIKDGDIFKEYQRNTMYDNELNIYMGKDASAVNEFAFATASADNSVISALSNATIKLERLPCENTKVTIDQQKQQLTVSWPAVEGLTGCEVYRDDVLIAWVTDANKYVDKSAKPGVVYNYQTKLIKENCITESKTDYSRYIVQIPTVKTKVNKHNIEVSWSNCDDASTYVIYRKTSADGAWKKLDYHGYSPYYDSDVKNGYDYYYTVQVISFGEGEGGYNKTGVKGSYFRAVKNVKATQTTTSITLSWDKVNGATGYRVYRYDSSTGKYTELGTVKKLNAKITGLKSGTTYSYLVRPYRLLSNGKEEWAAYSSSDIITTATKSAAPTLKATAGTKKFTLSWNKVAGASHYEVWYSTSANGTYKLLTTVKGTSYSKSCTTGKTYYFKVRAMTNVGSATIKGEASAAKGVKIK